MVPPEVFLLKSANGFILFLTLASTAAAQNCTQAMVPMRDGVKLSTSVCLPDVDGRWPTVLTRTPYNKDRQETASARNYTSRKYARVIQDVRGRFKSEGKYRPWLDDILDGYDTVEWIAAQPWSDGKVGMIGGSAPGIAANMAALSAPPHLTCVYVAKAIPSAYQYASYPGGVFLEDMNDKWLAGRGILPTPGPRPRIRDYDEIARQTDMTRVWEKVTVPTYNLGGWYDIFLQGNIDMFTGLQAHGGGKARGNQKLVMNASGHGALSGEVEFPSDAARVPPQAESRWFEYWLKGVDNGIMKEPPVDYFVMGANEWRTAAAWPPPSTTARYYLSGAQLALSPSADKSQFSGYTYDPRNPVPTVGGNNLTLPKGPMDQRAVSSRPDVLKFETSALTSPVEIAGPVYADLWVATDAEDTDFMAKLVDVYPNGYEALVLDQALRLRYRDSLEHPVRSDKNRPYRIRIDLWSTALRFQTGHKIALHVSSSNSPRFERHSNTWLPTASYSDAFTAHNRVYRDKDHASALVLPVVKLEE